MSHIVPIVLHFNIVVFAKDINIVLSTTVFNVNSNWARDNVSTAWIYFVTLVINTHINVVGYVSMFLLEYVRPVSIVTIVRPYGNNNNDGCPRGQPGKTRQELIT
jgi:hypothetical protein